MLAEVRGLITCTVLVLSADFNGAGGLYGCSGACGVGSISRSTAFDFCCSVNRVLQSITVCVAVCVAV